MVLRTRFMAVLLMGVAVLVGCGGERPSGMRGEVPPTPRRMVVWLDDDGVDLDTAQRLVRVGVDELVVRRGTIRLSRGAPVVQLLPQPSVEGPIPTAVALEILGAGTTEPDAAAAAVWAALEADFGGGLPTELILDFPEIGEGAGEFVFRLGQHSGLSVVPILSVSQIGTEIGQEVVKAAHRCIVPVFGSQDSDLRGLSEMELQALPVRLAALKDLGVRVRVAAALRPKTEPGVDRWAEDIDVLTDDTVAEIRRTSILDRSFVFRSALTWGGHPFGVGDTVAVAWVDAARLGLFFTESQRTILPEIEGWDLVSLPPEGHNLGLDREELIRYLGGEGPAPDVSVSVRRNGRNLTVNVVNSSVFRSAITGFGNWVQVELLSGALVASSRGGFDRVILGSMENGEWRQDHVGGPDAVRFVETYLGPGEELQTGSVRLPSSRSKVRVRWQVQVSDGSAIGGVVE